MSKPPVAPTSRAPSARGVPSDLTDRLRLVRDALVTGLVERDVAVRLALIAALAGEHLLLLGPPGTGKSLIARRLRLAFRESSYFERLLTRFTVPEELFGPLSIKGLEEDRYERLTASYLPAASIGFLDEIFKANSAILNALLTLLNEREFDNGTRRVTTPLVAVIGASNELPEGEELDALFDRFLLRLHVGPVSSDNFTSLIRLRGEAIPKVPADARLTAEDLAAVRRAAERVKVPKDVEALLFALREWCNAEGIEVSDRRWRKVVKLLQVSALTNGRDAVSIWDCWLLQHCTWAQPEDREKVYDWYADRVGVSAAMDSTRLTRIVVSWEARLKADKESRSQMRDEEGRPLYLGSDGEATIDTSARVQAMRNGEGLFLAPAGAHTNNNYNWQPVRDRANGRRGFTASELRALYVSDPRHQWCMFDHWPHRDAYLADPASRLMKDVDLAPAMEPTRHKPAHIEACLGDIRDLMGRVDAYREELEKHVASLESDIRSHVWVTEDFVQPAVTSLDGTRREVEALKRRIERLEQGFELLPREADRVEPSPSAGPKKRTSTTPKKTASRATKSKPRSRK